MTAGPKVEIAKGCDGAPSKHQVGLVNVGKAGGMRAKVIRHRGKDRVGELANEPRTPGEDPQQSMEVKGEQSWGVRLEHLYVKA